MCRNCGGVFAADTLEPRGSLGIEKELDYSSDEDVSDSDKKRHEIVCNSCGAVLAKPDIPNARSLKKPTGGIKWKNQGTEKDRFDSISTLPKRNLMISETRHRQQDYL